MRRAHDDARFQRIAELQHARVQRMKREQELAHLRQLVLMVLQEQKQDSAQLGQASSPERGQQALEWLLRH